MKNFKLQKHFLDKVAVHMCYYDFVYNYDLELQLFFVHNLCFILFLGSSTMTEGQRSKPSLLFPSNGPQS